MEVATKEERKKGGEVYENTSTAFLLIGKGSRGKF